MGTVSKKKVTGLTAPLSGYEHMAIKSSTVETITPEKAAKYLENNINNRTIKKSIVNRYMDDIAQGLWRETHQAIAFDSRGRLVDGQHRLVAVAKGTKSITSLVVRYAGEITTKCAPFDSGKKRTTTDKTDLTLVEVSVTAPFHDLFPKTFNTAVAPYVVLYLHDGARPQIAQLEEITGRSIKSANARRAGSGLAAIYTGWFKATCIIALSAGIDISNVMDFDNDPPKRAAYRLFFEWVDGMMELGAPTKDRKSAMAALWNVLKYNKFVDPYSKDRTYMTRIQGNIEDMQDILRQKYPQVFIG